MKHFLFTLLFVAALGLSLNAQIKINEGFETSDSNRLPTGWTVLNNASFPVDPWANWTVRDSGRWMPNLTSTRLKPHTGTRAIAVTWGASIDSVSGASTIADAWLITKKISGISSNTVLKFWACGGSTSYMDSLEIWISTGDSMPYSFIDRIGSIAWTSPSVVGNYQQYTYNLGAFSSNPDIYIAFRYYMDCSYDGCLVELDDVYVGPPVSVSQIGTNVPDKFTLHQNYPNPFNPVTNIKFEIAKSSSVKLIVYDALGKEVSQLANEYKNPGVYEVKFDASRLSSGVYYYKLIAGDFIETRKMMVLK